MGLDATPSGGTKARAKVRIVQQPVDAFRELRGIPRSDGYARDPIERDVRHPRRDGGIDDGFPCGHRLELDQAERFAARDGRKCEHVRSMVVRGNIRDSVQEDDPLSHADRCGELLELVAKRAVADEYQAAPHAGHRPDEILEPLVAHLTADGEDEPVAVLCTDPLYGGSVSAPEALRLDAERQYSAPGAVRAQHG